jgi:hydrogenase-4 component B
MSWLLAAGAGLIGLGALLPALSRRIAAGLWLQAVGAVLLGAVGTWALVSGSTVGSAFTSSFTPQLGVDPLSGTFLLILGLVAAPALIYATGYLSPTPAGRTTAALCGPFVLALAGVLVARDPLTFLTCWELMTLVPAAIILVGRHDEAARRTAFVYVSVTHLGGAGVWIALLLLAESGALGGAPLAEGSGLQAAVAIAAIVGFGTKAGVMPLHAWLPRAHPIAPAPVSALMSGVMVKVAVYGLIRVLVEWIGPAPLWVGAAVVALGAASALVGILYAVFQAELKRLLAFSTIDNVGIALLGVGACLVLRDQGDDTWAAIALGAALLHCVTHAAAKGGLFLGAGALERAVGSLELDGLGGLLRRMPVTGGALVVVAASIAGLPPLAGFASEWVTLQALLHLPATGGVAAGTVGAVALGGLAAAAALAVFCFVKVVGMALLGSPRRSACATAVEAPVSMRLGLGALAVACIALGLAPGLLFASLVDVAPWGVDASVTVGLRLPSTGDLPTPGIALVLVALTGALVLLRGSRTAAPSPTWASGQAAGPRLAWTSAGFTKSLRLVLEAVLRPEREVTVETRGGVLQEVGYRGRVPHLVDEHVYRPVTAGALRGAEVARRLQTGRIGTYVAYLIALVLGLLLVVRLGIVG